jgi:demethylmenaquinone methyltransferase/2-methoxy-6-polyprenyl-1,4-benzoquinol methylase
VNAPEGVLVKPSAAENSSTLVSCLPVPTPGAPEKHAVRSMFDRIAPRYDLLNRLLSLGTDRRWRRAAVDYLELPGHARVLDLCTGTADLMIEALSRGARRRAVGLDLSLPMLERGGGKLHRRGLSERGALLAGDAERLPFAASAFDGAMVAFGIRNIGAVEAALGELLRVLRAGGRLVVLEFGRPRGVLGDAFQLYFERVLPRLGGAVSGDRAAYAYLPASVGRFPEPAAFAGLLRRAGFVRVEWRPLTLGVAHLFRADVESR